MDKKRAQKQFQRLIEELKEKKNKYKVKPNKRIDWSSYDRAQINELNDMLLIIRDGVEEVKQRLEIKIERARGRPSYSPFDLAKAVLLQQYFQCSNRVTEGLVELFKEKLWIEESFSYKTLERAYEDPLIILILKELFELSQEPTKEKSMSLDGSGLPQSLKQNWERDKKEGSTKDYLKLIASFGSETKLICSFTLVEGTANESPYFQPLVQQAFEHHPIELVTADSAFLSRANCSMVESIGAKPRIYPKKNVTLKKKGSKAWAEMLLSFIEDSQQWLEEYHKRSIAESCNSSFKRFFTKPLMKRIDLRKKEEAYARVCDYNLKRLCYLKYFDNLSIKWGYV
jgi:transposase